jgi:hypothetical protein
MYDCLYLLFIGSINCMFLELNSHEVVGYKLPEAKNDPFGESEWLNVIH